MTSQAESNTFAALCCLLPLAAAVAALVINLAKRPQRQAALAARWEAMRESTRRHPSARLCFVAQVHQRARTGTKAFIRWEGTATRRQDAWFRGISVTPGTYALVEGFYRYGPHRHEPHLFEVTNVIAVAPASAYRAWQHLQQRPVAR